MSPTHVQDPVSTEPLRLRYELVTSRSQTCLDKAGKSNFQGSKNMAPEQPCFIFLFFALLEWPWHLLRMLRGSLSCLSSTNELRTGFYFPLSQQAKGNGELGCRARASPEVQLAHEKEIVVPVWTLRRCLLDSLGTVIAPRCYHTFKIKHI